MRLYQVLSLALLSLVVHTGCDLGSTSCNLKLPYGVPHSCANPLNHDDGTSQGKCRSGFGTTAFCDPDLTCIDHVCIPCGEGTQACCDLPSGTFCTDPATHCDNSEQLDWPTCVGGCQAGDSCCADGFCASGGLCNHDTDICEAPPANQCVTGDTKFTVSIVDQFGCVVGEPESFQSDNPTDAQTCAQAFLDAHNPDGTLHLGPIDGVTTCANYCAVSLLGDGNTPESACAFSPQELATCEQSFCNAPNCSIEPTCPM